MLVDHIRYAIPILNTHFTMYVGRISFPLFAFMISEGYIHTSNLKKYFKRLVITAIISQIPFMLFRTLVGEWRMLNVIFTLILGLASITVFDKINKKYISLPICFLFVLAGYFLKVDYGWYGVLMVLIFFIGKKSKLILGLLYLALNLGYFYFLKLDVLKNFIYFISLCIPLIIVFLYKGEKGNGKNKFFYYFYPIHMFALWLISLI